MKHDWFQNNCLVFVIFFIYNFHLSFVALQNFVMQQRKYLIFCSQIAFHLSFAFSFLSLFSQMLANIINTRMEIRFYIAYSIFSGSVGHFVVRERNNKICCFLISFTQQVEIFLNFWPFTYSTLNERCLEIWSCICGYHAYGLFLCFRSFWNIPIKARDIKGGLRAISSRLTIGTHWI